MGFWPLWKYVDYVRTHAEGADRFDLRQPHGKPLDDQNPSISITYYSMPLWMNEFDVDLGESNMSFRRHRHVYQSACEDYIGQVREQFEPIKSSMTGRALLDEIRDTGHRLRIVPYWTWYKPSANAVPWDGFIFGETAEDMESWKAATARGSAVVIQSDGTPLMGAGSGAHSQIRFTPSMYHARSGPGQAPDEVLFHELVHASREMKGVFFRMPVNKGYLDLEEYLAIILCNVYLSEKRQQVFVGTHDGRAILRGADADNFLHNAQRVDIPPTMVIQNFKDSQPKFYRAIVNVPPARAKYNWVRQYEEEARKIANRLPRRS